MLPVLLFVTSFTILPYICEYSYFTSIWLSCIIAYLPSYFDRSEYEPGFPTRSGGSRTWHIFQYWSGMTWLMNLFKPNSTIVYENEEACKQYKQVIYATHPHGVMSFNHVFLMTNVVGFLKKTLEWGHTPHRDLAATILFRIPLARDLVLWCGNIDASKPTAEKALSRGWSLQLYPGGEHEQLLTSHTKTSIYIKRRHGFIRLALQYGLPIIPIFAFNEDRLYTTSYFLFRPRLWIVKHLRIAFPIFWGKYGTIWPHQHPLYIVVGAPIPVTKCELPTHQQVEDTLETYIKALTELYERHKCDPQCHPNYRDCSFIIE